MQRILPIRRFHREWLEAVPSRNFDNQDCRNFSPDLLILIASLPSCASQQETRRPRLNRATKVDSLNLFLGRYVHPWCLLSLGFFICFRNSRAFIIGNVNFFIFILSVGLRIWLAHWTGALHTTRSYHEFQTCKWWGKTLSSTLWFCRIWWPHPPRRIYPNATSTTSLLSQLLSRKPIPRLHDGFLYLG